VPQRSRPPVSQPCTSEGSTRASAIRWLIVSFGLTREAAELTLDAADCNGRCRHLSGFEVEAVPARHFGRDGSPICLYTIRG